MGFATGQINALLVAPNRQLAEEFIRSAEKTRGFNIAGDLNSYPAPQVLDHRIRQLRPDVLLVDVCTDLETAGNLIRMTCSIDPPVHVIGLHTHADSEAILRSLRYGASEFLYAPFDTSVQEAAVNRIQKLIQPSGRDRARGTVVAFSTAKPGSGASTLAVHTAHALRRVGHGHVLLVDLDLVGGTTGFNLKLRHERSIIDLIEPSQRITNEIWSGAIADACGIDVILAPEVPYLPAIPPKQLGAVVEYARCNYDWVVVDLPLIFSRVSAGMAGEADRAFLISTPELASLHMTRVAVKLLGQNGLDMSKFRVLINRSEPRQKLNGSDLAKLFECGVDTGIPEDRLTIERAVTLGRPIEPDSAIGRGVDALTGRLLRIRAEQRQSKEATPGLTAAVSKR
jgi:pilus assembly protein CpaE